MLDNYKLDERGGWGEAIARGILEGLIRRDGTSREVECKNCNRRYWTKYNQSTCHRCGNVNYDYGPLHDTIIPMVKKWLKKKMSK